MAVCNKWNINTPFSLLFFYLFTKGCWAEGPISGLSETCKQHCQAQFPVEHWAKTPNGVWRDGTGWLAAAVLEDIMQHIIPQPALLRFHMAGQALRSGTHRDALIHSRRGVFLHIIKSKEKRAYCSLCFWTLMHIHRQSIKQIPLSLNLILRDCWLIENNHKPHLEINHITMSVSTKTGLWKYFF